MDAVTQVFNKCLNTLTLSMWTKVGQAKRDLVWRDSRIRFALQVRRMQCQGVLAATREYDSACRRAQPPPDGFTNEFVWYSTKISFVEKIILFFVNLVAVFPVGGDAAGLVWFWWSCRTVRRGTG